MSKALHVQQKEVIAIDFSTLYASLEHPIMTQQAFEAKWEETDMEAVHFTAGQLKEGDGYVDSIITQLLEVAAAYLHLDPDHAPTAHGFGLLLCSYLYFTQPSTCPTHRIKMGVDAYRTMLKRIPSWPNAELLRHTLAALVASDAIELCPYVNNGPALTAVTVAHDLFECPLINLEQLKADSEALTKRLREALERATKNAKKGNKNNSNNNDLADGVRTDKDMTDIAALKDAYMQLRKGMLP